MHRPPSSRRRTGRLVAGAALALIVVAAVVVTQGGDGGSPEADPSRPTDEAGAPGTLQQLSGVPVMVYGDSWSTAGGWHAVGRHWTDLLTERLDIGTLVNKGIGGSTMEDTANVVGGDTDAAWPFPDDPTCVLVMSSLNAAIEPDTDPNHRERSLASARAAATTVAALLLSDEYSEDRTDLITFEGDDWITYPGLALEGRSLLHATAGSITFTVPEGYDRRQLWLATIVGVATTTFSIEHNGIQLGEHTTPVSEVGEPGFSKYLLPIDKVSSGDTVTVRRVTGDFWFDGMYLDSGRHHVVFANEVDDLPNSGYSDIPLLRAHNQVIRDVVDEVNGLVPGGASLIDLESAFGWDPATMTGPDRIHPNDAGQEWILGVVLEELRGVPDTRRLHAT